ncbi:carboxymuconolactone decarboxylase family protein [Streptomyces sp. RKND-216]|uniref:carboxymuconolactone decarboxylase family protein n=1 Tax=Streptomyces sp. RKND-216 TaxID=2562581 RepID=UPI00109DFB20|nr:carboxymuconolactone decarboxylase family protein [Streptomyces sp. RKND-216]THA25542.1 carboxymuconolactone decarboxylase family protein [Streptomyces sp. RKND-216]
MFVRHDVASAPEGARPHLENTARGFGFVPAPVAMMAESPELLEGFLTGSQLFDKTSFTLLEREVLILTMASSVECHYCVAMHSAMLTRSGTDASLVDALRERRPLEDTRLEALRVFTLAVMAGCGSVRPDLMQGFLDAGYTRRNALEVVLGLGVYTLSTYSNRMTEAPVDEPFRAFAWHPQH